MKVGIVGSGAVGLALARGLAALDHAVSIGSRDGHAVEGWEGGVGTFADVAAAADIVILTVKGTAAEKVVADCVEQLASKTVIDTTNPIADAPPIDGVLQYFTAANESLMERLQAIAPNAHFVKAFNSVGNALMVHPEFTDGTPTMFICGNEESAKAEVTGILQALGWDVQELGTARAAGVIEQLCILWCLPGMRTNDWNHALAFLRG